MTVHVWPDIREVPLFRSRLDDNERSITDDLGFVLKSYPQGAMIGCRTDEDSKIFLIHSGWGCLYSGLADGDCQVIDFPLKGDIVMPCAHQNDANEMLVANTAMVVLEASASTLFQGLVRSPRLSSAFWAAIARQRAILVQHFTSVGSRRALARVAHFLLELAVRLEQSGESTRYGYKCPLTQYDLADALGLTGIHVNRMLRELRERELVEFRQGLVRFLNRPGLEGLAGFDAAYLG